ncbi:MAG: 30S ribosomal protein S4e [Promethearchaeota archaeon]
MGNKGSSRHRKRLAAPIPYRIPRKHGVFTVNVSPGPHPLKRSVPLAIIVRDMLKKAETYKEARRIIKAGNVKVDHRIRKDPRFPVGIMDVLAFETIDEFYRMIPFKGKRQIRLKQAAQDEVKTKLCRIEGKTSLKKNIVQLNLHDGRNIQLEADEGNKYKTRGTLEISLPKQEILSYFPFEAGQSSIVIGGTNVGTIATLESFEKRIGRGKSVAVLKTEDDETVRTSLEQIFILGSKMDLVKE